MRSFQFFTLILDERKDQAVLAIRGTPVSGIIRGSDMEYRDLYTDAWGIADYCDRCAANGGVDVPDPLEELPVRECQAKMQEYIFKCMKLYRRANELGNSLRSVGSNDQLLEAATWGKLDPYFETLSGLLNEASERKDSTSADEILAWFDEAAKAHKWDMESVSANVRQQLGYVDEESQGMGV